MTAPSDRPTGRLPGLGVDSHLEGLSAADRKTEFARLADMGATWVRLGAPWYALQPRAGQFDPGQVSELRQTVDDATAAGLRVLMVGDQAPDWAGGGDATASRPESYGAFMGQVAEQLRGRGPGGTSPAYELMNEPNGLASGDRTWATPDDYARSSCAAYQTIRRTDPTATVLAGSLDVTDWEEWLRSALRAGLGRCFDALSAHPYSGLAVLGDIRALAGREGRPDVPIWVTEFGASTCSAPLEGCVSEDEQAAGMVRTVRELAGDYPWVPVAIAYESRDEPTVDGGLDQRSFGLFSAPSGASPPRPKPVVAALRRLYLGS